MSIVYTMNRVATMALVLTLALAVASVAFAQADELGGAGPDVPRPTVRQAHQPCVEGPVLSKVEGRADRVGLFRRPDGGVGIPDWAGLQLSRGVTQVILMQVWGSVSARTLVGAFPSASSPPRAPPRVLAVVLAVAWPAWGL